MVRTNRQVAALHKRLHEARALLYIHECLTEKQRLAVAESIQRWQERELRMLAGKETK